MSLRTSVLAPALAGLMLVEFGASAQHLIDIAISVNNQGAIATGTFQVQGLNVVTVPSSRVFITEFGLEFPSYTDNPGIDSLVGAFQGGSQIGFNIRKALRKWDGTQFPLGPEGIPPEQIQIQLGPAVNTAVTPLTDVLVPGFSLSVSNGGNNIGEYHHHPGFTLLDPASDGIYLLEMELWSTQPGLATSPPYWELFGQNASMSDLQTAATWVTNNIWMPTCPADLNADGVVDDSDFAIFVVAYNELDCGATGAPACSGDLNGDWLVDDSDFVIFVAAYDNLLCP
jgi:hypothetical protein